MTSKLPSKEFQCGYCGNLVASQEGFHHMFAGESQHIYICPHCHKPTFFDSDDSQMPGVAPGNEVAYLPENIKRLYWEARNCVTVGAFTASVLVCRKLLMHIAVAQGAQEGQRFEYYVDHLSNMGFVPPNGRPWVDYIRKKGNEANHEISLMRQTDAEELITFLEMLLKLIYEFPARLPAPE